MLYIHGVSPRLQILLQIASVIDLKREKIESALTESRREQLTGQVEILLKHFHSEYGAFETENGADQAGESQVAENALRNLMPGRLRT